MEMGLVQWKSRDNAGAARVDVLEQRNSLDSGGPAIVDVFRRGGPPTVEVCDVGGSTTVAFL